MTKKVVFNGKVQGEWLYSDDLNNPHWKVFEEFNSTPKSLFIPTTSIMIKLYAFITGW